MKYRIRVYWRDSEIKMLKPNSTVSRSFVEELLLQHGVCGIYDNDLGPSLADSLGVHDTYKLKDVKIWLGY